MAEETVKSEPAGGAPSEGQEARPEKQAVPPAKADYRPPRAGGVLRIRESIPAWMAWALGVAPVLVLLAAWFVVTAGADPESRIISPTILPSPVEVLKSFPSLWVDRALVRNLLVSFGRVLQGFGFALAVVFPLGVLMGGFTKIKAMFSPLSVFAAYIPIPTLVPLTLSLFGTGELQKTAFLALAFGIYLLPLIVQAVDAVDDTYLKTAYTLGAGRWQAVRKVLLAIAWPDIFQALRMGFGVGWSYIMLVEMVDMAKGIGGLIMISQRRGPREHVYLVLLAIVAVAFLTDRLWGWVGKQLFPYRQEKR